MEAAVKQKNPTLDNKCEGEKAKREEKKRKAKSNYSRNTLRCSYIIKLLYKERRECRQ